MAKILVVDDEAAIVRFLKAFLEKRGYTVATALDGGEAIEKLRADKPDVILLDIRLGDKNGLDVLKEAKSIAPDVAVVMITAVSDEEIGKRALELGAFDYIMKPFELPHLEKVLRWTTKLAT